MLRAFMERDGRGVENVKGISPTMVGFLTWQAGAFVALLFAPLVGAFCWFIDFKTATAHTWQGVACWGLVGAILVYSSESPVDAVTLSLKVIPTFWALAVVAILARALLRGPA